MMFRGAPPWIANNPTGWWCSSTAQKMLRSLSGKPAKEPDSAMFITGVLYGKKKKRRR